MQGELFDAAACGLAFRSDPDIRGTAQIGQGFTRGSAVGNGMGFHVGGHGLQHGKSVGIVDTDNHVTGGPAGVGNERGTVVGFVAVMVEMIGFTVGDNGDGRMVFGEAAVRFIGFGHQDIAFARVSAVQRGAVRALDKAADGVAWIGTGVHQNVGQHGAGGGFAVRSGHGDGSFAVHEQGEDVTAMHNTLARRVCCDDFRIVRFDGAGVDHGLGLGDIFGSLPEFNGDAQRFKSVGFGAVCAIGAVHRDSFGVQHFGQNAHTGTADTDEMGGAEIRGAGRSIE